MFVVTIAKKHKNKEYKTTLIRESYRLKGKVKTKTIANISKLPENIIETIKMQLKGDKVKKIDESVFKIKSSIPHGHIYTEINPFCPL